VQDLPNMAMLVCCVNASGHANALVGWMLAGNVASP
jgi:hypothetical protein